mmetsp:Transcript_55408/g.132050  ORF Transcript_55408/g.132050 Transcript_55408/m.132050 type:complete len:588 (-) Transcript_55408:107-1870(-)
MVRRARLGRCRPAGALAVRRARGAGRVVRPRESRVARARRLVRVGVRVVEAVRRLAAEAADADLAGGALECSKLRSVVGRRVESRLDDARRVIVVRDLARGALVGLEVATRAHVALRAGDARPGVVRAVEAVGAEALGVVRNQLGVGGAVAPGGGEAVLIVGARLAGAGHVRAREAALARAHVRVALHGVREGARHVRDVHRLVLNFVAIRVDLHHDLPDHVALARELDAGLGDEGFLEGLGDRSRVSVRRELADDRASVLVRLSERGGLGSRRIDDDALLGLLDDERRVHLVLEFLELGVDEGLAVEDVLEEVREDLDHRGRLLVDRERLRRKLGGKLEALGGLDAERELLDLEDVRLEPCLLGSLRRDPPRRLRVQHREHLEELLDEVDVARDRRQLRLIRRLVRGVRRNSRVVGGDGGRRPGDREVLHLDSVRVRLLGELVRSFRVHHRRVGIHGFPIERGRDGLLGVLLVDEALKQVVEELNNGIALPAEPVVGDRGLELSGARLEQSRHVKPRRLGRELHLGHLGKHRVPAGGRGGERRRAMRERRARRKHHAHRRSGESEGGHNLGDVAAALQRGALAHRG